MCENCQQLEIAVQRYRKLLARGHDPRILEIQRCRKLRAQGLDPLTIGRINAAIQQLVQNKPADAQTADHSALGSAALGRFVAATRPPATWRG